MSLVAALAARPARAQADEPTLRLMRESISYTEVLDAVDADDRFDLNAQVAFNRSSDRGTIQREYTSRSGERRRQRVAESERVTSLLMFSLEVGLFRDLMAFIRLPLTLRDARSLSAPRGQGAAAIAARLTDPDDDGGADGELFEVPFTSPTRAGFDYIGMGASWGILNQQREPYYPNWLVMIEGRRAIGTPFKPCARIGTATTCGAEAGVDENGDGQDDGSAGRFADDGFGSSRGLSGFQVETRTSYRYRYLEPYMGLSFLVEWPATGKRYFHPAGNLDGSVRALPSRTTAGTLGAAFIPWENRARFQRVALDLRWTVAHVSKGHDYSALFDALGTSTHAQLSRVHRGSDASGSVDRGQALGSQVPFYGLTDLQARVKYGVRMGLEMQAAQYVRFAFGSALNWVTAHAITSSSRCNPDVSRAPRTRDVGSDGCSIGIVNPAYRPTIDGPGRRFWMVGEFIVDLYATATAQF